MYARFEVISDLNGAVACMARESTPVRGHIHRPIRHVSHLDPIHLLAGRTHETTLYTCMERNSVWELTNISVPTKSHPATATISHLLSGLKVTSAILF